MNVDEAIALSRVGYATTLSKLDLVESTKVLADEVHRLRKEVAKLQAQLDVAAAAAMVDLKHMLDDTAKAQQKKG